MRITVVGGGVAGLGSALALSRSGHEVTVVERDDTPMPETALDAFDWDRRGAPQVRQSHTFLARLRNILRDDYPDVLQALLDAGATEMRFADLVPDTLVDFELEPGDDDIAMISSRRSTFEWVVRKFAIDAGQVTFRTGVGVDGVIVDESRPAGGVPVVTGVHLADGSTIESDLVVVAGGRRNVLPEWLGAIGVAPVPEESEDCGIVYFSRFYELKEGEEYPPRTGSIGGDLGYLKYGMFMGDNRTFSLTLASPVEDDELRKVLADDDHFETIGRALVASAPWLDGRAEPISSVHVMAGLLNRWREYVVDGEPLALGIIPVGDAVVCTNPLYGRGCSTAFWAATLLSSAIDTSGGDLRAISVGYDEALRDQILPWYRATVDQDSEARRVAAALLRGEDPDSDTTDPRTFIRGVLRDGLLPAVRTDGVVMRAFMRSLNLLDDPDAMTKDQDVGARVLAVWQDRDNRPAEPPLGPKQRADLFELINA